jgi:hypothetical protein
MTKKSDFRTKKKVIEEARIEENKSEVIEWMKTQFLATVKAREILEEYFEDTPNTGERN